MTTATTQETQAPTKDMLDAIEAVWRGRVQTMQMKPNSMAMRKAEVEFFCGAMAAFTAMGYSVPVGWTVCIMSGRPIYKATP
jgi:hypothetical protein